ncbi:hypothetical protein [Phenylobacterium sp.]|uniref:hypothetical protein n=1 Tax=Phenylobacterium sp. TaxID=1871053 RepID=UPI0035AE14D3
MGGRITAWGSRAALVLVLAVAFIGATDANERWRSGLKPDQVSHGALSFALTILLLAAFRRVPAWVLGGGVFALGAGLEGLQGLGLFAGDAQLRDLISDLCGVLAAALPYALGRAHGRRAAARERPEPATRA